MYQLQVLLVVLPLAAFGQTAFDVPFASANNVLQLTIENNSFREESEIRVFPLGVPPWLYFEPSFQTIPHLNPKDHATVSFSFSIDETAPVDHPVAISVHLTTSSGQSGTRVLRVKVAAPERFTLFQNYPNPFNATTIIAYELTSESMVHLNLYNLVGQEVSRRTLGIRFPGHHQVAWDAQQLPSGVYFYELAVREVGGKEISERKSMLLIK